MDGVGLVNWTDTSLPLSSSDSKRGASDGGATGRTSGRVRRSAVYGGQPAAGDHRLTVKVRSRSSSRTCLWRRWSSAAISGRSSDRRGRRLTGRRGRDSACSARPQTKRAPAVQLLLPVLYRCCCSFQCRCYGFEDARCSLLGGNRRILAVDRR